MSKKLFLSVFVGALTLVGGCSVKVKNTPNLPSTPDVGGVFKSINKGGHWRPMSLVNSTQSRPVTFNEADTAILKMDPSDSKTLYFVSRQGDMLYTIDGANSWNLVRSWGQKPVNDLAIDPRAHCIIYVASGNKLFKSVDCTRNWEEVYVDPDPNAQVKSIVIDHYDTDRILIGLSRGDLILSANGGEGWQTVARLDGNIARIVADPNDSRNKYVLMESYAVWRYNKVTKGWDSLENNLKDFDFKAGQPFKMSFVLVPDKPGLIFLATPKILLISKDYGETWTKKELITPDKLAGINSLVVNPQNTDEIYYVTNTVFVRSFDGGESWQSRKLKTLRGGWKLLIDPQNPNVLYMGFYNYLKKK
ncbi:hypothetical protein D6821_02460 [Candidatus Parcubacteria bacterium]|nr:MAG: hypothetical protein D6821_02460 [Candidatus Parcubacteria bacterium]